VQEVGEGRSGCNTGLGQRLTPVPMPTHTRPSGFDQFEQLIGAWTTDGRGMRRVYQMSLADGVWKLWGQAGHRFFQRFQGTFSDDLRTIAAYWDRSENNRSWQLDFDSRYTKSLGRATDIGAGEA
jgi:hypothetical protein